MSEYEIGFLGYGKMAQAISAGLNQSGRVPYARQAATARDQNRLARLAEENGFAAMSGNEELINKADKIILAVKPHQVAEIMGELHRSLKSQLIISVVAGLTLSALEDMAPPSVTCVRTMPNTPALVGAGVTAFCLGADRDENLVRSVREIFEPLGFCFEIEEKLFDAVSSLSGCGPAYFFTFMEALTDGGVRLGLPRDLAQTLAARTALGSAELALSSSAPFSELKALSTSPGGMTMEALYRMEQKSIRGIIMEAMEAATEKAKILTK